MLHKQQQQKCSHKKDCAPEMKTLSELFQDEYALGAYVHIFKGKQP